MKRYDTIQLIKESPVSHGVFDSATETMREVFCEVRSVSRSEVYAARAAGVEPSAVFVLALAEDYENEKELLYHDTRYRVVRTYIAEDGIELTAEVAKIAEN